VSHVWLIAWETAPGWPGDKNAGTNEVVAPTAHDAVFMWEANLPAQYGKTGGVNELRRFVSISHLRAL